MNRQLIPVIYLFFSMLLALGCSGGDNVPVNPSSTPDLPVLNQNPETISQTNLWGFYDVFFDFETQSIEAVVNRSAMSEYNVVQFINGNPANLSFNIINTIAGPGYVDVDLDVSITHPFAGQPEYNGYDVRGVFIGDGSSSMAYNNDLQYAVHGSDQTMLDDPINNDGGNADGYTRYFNPTEFFVPGLFGYTIGLYATPNYTGSATLNPYKIFANGLGSHDDAYVFISTQIFTGNNVFTAGSTNTRNFYVRFPVPVPNAVYNYAIIASWTGPLPQDHPSNTPEVIACNATVTEDIYYINPITNGGDLIVDFGLAGYGFQPDTIYIESDVLTSVASFNPATILTGTGATYSEYHIDIPADNITGNTGNEGWIIAEYDNYDYTNPFNIPNNAGTDLLAAIFRFDVPVLNYIPTQIEVLIPNGGEVWVPGSTEEITWTSQNLTGTVFIEYSKDNFVSDINMIATGETDDGSYMWVGIPCDISDTVRVRVSSTVNPGVNDVSDADFSIPGTGWAQEWAYPNTQMSFGVDYGADGIVCITGATYDPSGSNSDVFLAQFNSCGTLQWSVTWGGAGSDYGYGVVVTSSGDTYISGVYSGSVDFDPGAGTDTHVSSGSIDAFLSKFDSSGAFQWARTWGGTSWDGGNKMAVDGSGNVYVTGFFNGTVDFDPGVSNDFHMSNGLSDAFLSKFDSSGTFLWARTWGGSWDDNAIEPAVDNSGNIYITGTFALIVDFDPGAGTDNHSAIGGSDAFLSKFNSSGNFQWAGTWGGISTDSGNGVACDSSGNVLVTGSYRFTADFDPGAGTDNHTSNGFDDAFLSKFDQSGALQWALTWGGTSLDYAYGVAADGVGSSFVGGTFRSTSDFDPGAGIENHSTNGDYDAFLSKFDSSGTFQWVRTWGAAFGDNIRGVSVDGPGNVFTTGAFADNVDFAPVDPPCNAPPDIHSPSGFYDAFLTRHLSDGCW